MAATRISDAQLIRACAEVPVGIQWFAADGTVLWANDAAVAFTDGRDGPIREIFAATRDNTRRIDAILSRLRSEGARALSAIAVVDDGRHGQRHLRIDGQREEAGSSFAVRCFTRDITPAVDAERAMLDTERIATDLHQLKAEFLSNISHELRTPLNGIVGYVELALDTVKEPEPREYLEQTRTCAQDLLTSIENLLQLSNLDARRIVIDPIVVEPAPFFDKLVRRFERKAAEKGIALECEVDPSVPARVLADATALRRTIDQLVANAIKFTDAGAVMVRVSIDAMATGGVALHVAVADTGVGIPDERRDMLMQPFVQADGSSTRRYGGLGIGLAIVQELVTLMHGRLWIESRVGEGTTFHVRIPLDVVAQESATRTAMRVPLPIDPIRSAAWRSSALRVLVAESDAGCRMVAVRSLERRGHDVRAVENGEDAVKAFVRHPFDVVLMDVQLPRMDGLTAVSAMRREVSFHTPIVALTGQPMPGDGARFRAAGMDAWVTKPVNTQMLVATVEGLARVAL